METLEIQVTTHGMLYEYTSAVYTINLRKSSSSHKVEPAPEIFCKSLTC